MMADNNKKKGMTKIGQEEEEEEKENDKNSSDKYTRFMMENSALIKQLRAEMKNNDVKELVRINSLLKIILHGTVYGGVLCLIKETLLHFNMLTQFKQG